MVGRRGQHFLCNGADSGCLWLSGPMRSLLPLSSGTLGMSEQLGSKRAGMNSNELYL